MVAVLMDAPPPLSAVAPSVPPALGAVVDRALRKEADERWGSAAAFGEALRTADLAAEVDESAPSARLTIPAGEQRVVAVLLAEGVRNGAAIARAVEERGGRFLPLRGGRAIGVFGGAAWEGDELLRAAAAAVAARKAAERMSTAQAGRRAPGYFR